MTALETILAGPGTTKQFVAGSHRSAEPGETLARIKPYLPRAGITRLADITGLDNLGIPVTLAVRPGGRVLSVSSGKGLTLTSALVSGAMESVELHHAELDWSLPSVRRSYREMRAEHVVPDRSELALARSAVTCHTERWRRGIPPPLVDLDDVEFPTVRGLVDRLARSKVVTVVFNCTIDTQVPVYMAHVVDDSGLVEGTFTGYGAHLDPEIATSRAITEAVQARTVVIAGSRDDMYRHRELTRRVSGDRWRDWASSERHRARTVSPAARSAAAPTFEADVKYLRRSSWWELALSSASTLPASWSTTPNPISRSADQPT